MTTTLAYTLPPGGKLDLLQAVPRPMPEPGPKDILVRVRAASLNKRDLLILDGSYPMPARPGVVPLSDGVGEVMAVGAAVTRFKVGDRVAGCYFPRWRSGPIRLDLIDQLGCTLDGMLAQHVCLDQEWAVKLPEHLSWEEAATLPCAGLTAWNCLHGPVPVEAGQTVLTLGSGGVSTFALAFAKAAGARVIVTTSGEEKAARLHSLGADVVIDRSRQPHWGDAVREATGGAGADLVVEGFGADTIEESMRAVALHGQVMVLITRSATRPDLVLPSRHYAASMATIRRVFVGHRESFEAMNRSIALMGYRPVVEKVFGFDEAPAAYRHFLAGDTFGKVVITM
ncbi:MAG: NAD(P)-dependent alcohol dehydrogenase [Rhizobacter sp.]